MGENYENQINRYQKYNYYSGEQYRRQLSWNLLTNRPINPSIQHDGRKKHTKRRLCTSYLAEHTERRKSYLPWCFTADSICATVRHENLQHFDTKLNWNKKLLFRSTKTQSIRKPKNVRIDYLDLILKINIIFFNRNIIRIDSHVEVHSLLTWLYCLQSIASYRVAIVYALFQGQGYRWFFFFFFLVRVLHNTDKYRHAASSKMFKVSHSSQLVSLGSALPQ